MMLNERKFGLVAGVILQRDDISLTVTIDLGEIESDGHLILLIQKLYGISSLSLVEKLVISG